MKDKKQIMLDELSKEPEMVTATAYLYAKNYVHYGEDVTKAWATAVQQNAILEKAYNKGYSDALKERKEYKVKQIEQIVNAWNNDASHSFEDMCKINEVIKQE